MSSTSIRVVTESKEFESLAGVWDSLLQESEDDSSPYLTHEWLSTWWKHFGGENKLNILLIEKEHQAIGIVPLMKSEYRIGLLKVRTLETIGSVNCNYIGLIPPENREEGVTALLAYLEEELGNNGLFLRLTLVPEDSKLLDTLERHSAQFSKNLAIQETVMTLAPYISLPTTWDEYYRSLGRRRRKLLRMATRSLERAHSVEFQVCTAETLEDWLSKFFDLHQRRWQSVPVKSQFSNPKVREFYREIASKFLQRKWLHFPCLTIDNEIAQAQFSYVYNRKFYAAMIARDTRYSKYSIGHIHTMHSIRYAIGRQLEEFDFLRGDEPYKFYWTKSARRYVQVVVIKKGLCFELRLRFLRTLLRLYEIRQNGLRQSYRLRLMRKGEERERGKRMRLSKKLQ